MMRLLAISDLQCELASAFCEGGLEVLVTWVNNDVYDSIEILRDGELIGTVGGETTSFTDVEVTGVRQYDVQALLIGEPCAVSNPDGVCEIDTTPSEFIRGNANNDDRVNIADPVYMLNYLFVKGPTPPCLDSADVNDDGHVDIADPIKLVQYLFLEGDEPPPPFPDAGTDATCDNLDCDI